MSVSSLSCWVLAAAALWSVAGSAAAQEAPALEPSPAGEILVLDANLQEAFIAADVADPTDMQNFARRAAELLPFAPDVVLLQEVVGPSATNVAGFLSEATGFTYEVTIAPGPTAFPSADEETGEQVQQETAILINSQTVKAIGESGFFETRYDPADGIEGQKAKTKLHAFAAVKDVESKSVYPLMSLHFVPNQNFRSEEIGWAYKAEWARAVAEFFDESFPPPEWGGHVVGGDFNNRRCREVEESRECETFPFWDVMTADNGYSDMIFSAGAPDEIGTAKRIDYVFGRLDAKLAASDLAYDQGDKSDPATFYSDHRLIWSLLSDR
jgi:endonuclease/exonuclease/phosphatase family metal-dependent hydrolase